MRVAIIGCGTISRTHADVIKHLGAELVAVCDSDKARAENLRDFFGLPCGVYTDYKLMLDTEKPDAVHVCTPHYRHAEMIVYALNRGINVLSEKPVCIDVEQYREIKAAAKQSKAQLGVCFQNRYLSSNEFLKSAADSEKVKNIFAYVSWSRGKNYYQSTDWRGRKEREGGGVLMNQAIHTLDLIIWMAGNPVAVSGSVRNHHLKGVIDEEDTAEMIIEFESGATATFYATTAGAVDTPVGLSVTTEKGRYTVVGNRVYDSADLPVAINEKKDIIAKDYWGNGHLLLVRDFYRCIKENERFPIGITEAFKAVDVILELYKAGDERRKINFKEL